MVELDGWEDSQKNKGKYTICKKTTCVGQMMPINCGEDQRLNYDKANKNFHLGSSLTVLVCSISLKNLGILGIFWRLMDGFK